jgi:hypothetical protein
VHSAEQAPPQVIAAREKLVQVVGQRRRGLIAARVNSMPAAFRPLTTTWAPHPASARVMDRPSPREAPVTSATLPSSEKSFVTFDLRFAPVSSSASAASALGPPPAECSADCYPVGI